MFLSNTILRGKNSCTCISSNTSNMNVLYVMNGIFDDVFLSKNSDLSPIVNIAWDFNTVLHATYENHIQGGNVTFVLSNIDFIRLKRRKKGTQRWIPLINVDPKLFTTSFAYYDTFVQSNAEYEYAIIPVKDGIEGNFNIGEIRAWFDGLFVVDGDQFFRAPLDYSITSTTRNHAISVIGGYNQYPFVVSNNRNNYETGSAKGMFMARSGDDCGYNLTDAYIFRNRVKDFLANGKPKLVKYEDGRIWLAMVDKITDSPQGHKERIITSFDFVEIGNANSAHDLYKNGLLPQDLYDAVISSGIEL